MYDKETIEELNKKPKFWKDLMTGIERDGVTFTNFEKDEPFTAKDIIVLQDPTNLNTKTVENFHYIKENIDVSDCMEKRDITLLICS